MKKQGKPSQAKRLPKHAREQFLKKRWLSGDLTPEEIGDWCHSVINESCQAYKIAPDKLLGITQNIIELLFPRIFSPQPDPDPWKYPGGPLSYLRDEIEKHIKSIHDELQELQKKELEHGWREGKPDWEDIAPLIKKMAMVYQWDLSKAEDLAQAALAVMVKLANDGKTDISLIPYIWGVLRNLSIDQVNQEYRYTGLPIDYLNIPNKTDYHHAASAAATLEKRLEILNGINNEEIRELIDFARQQGDLLASLVADNPAPESVGNGDDPRSESQSSAETAEDLTGCNQQLLNGWNGYRKTKGLPPKTMEDLENVKRRIQRRVQDWILETALNRACGCCECSHFACEGHLHEVSCGIALSLKDCTVIDVRGAECKDPGRLSMARAVCQVCARIAGYWHDLQKCFEMSWKDSTEMWTVIFKSLRYAAGKRLRYSFSGLQHHFEVVEHANMPNGLAGLMVKTAKEGGGDAAFRQLADHLAYSVLEDFLSRKLPCRTGDVLREVFVRDIRHKIEEAEAAIRSAAEAAAHEVRELKEHPAKQIERQETQVSDEKVADKILQLEINCHCMDAGSGKNPSDYIVRAIFPAAQAPRPGETTVICNCKQARNFRIIGECHSNQKEPSYDSIKGSFEPEVQVSARQARAAEQEGLRIEKALVYLRLSYRRWMTATQAAPI
jgi:hypothetical protein